jgi:hypothetical protein
MVEIGFLLNIGEHSSPQLLEYHATRPRLELVSGLWFLVSGLQKLDEIPVLGLSLASVDECVSLA